MVTGPPEAAALAAPLPAGTDLRLFLNACRHMANVFGARDRCVYVERSRQNDIEGEERGRADLAAEKRAIPGLEVERNAGCMFACRSWMDIDGGESARWTCDVLRVSSRRTSSGRGGARNAERLVRFSVPDGSVGTQGAKKEGNPVPSDMRRVTGENAMESLRGNRLKARGLNLERPW